MPVSDEIKELKRLIECLLFVSQEPLKPDKLKEICQVSTEDLQLAIEGLAAEYAGRGFTLRQVAGGWQFFTAPEFVTYIELLYKPKLQQLSRASLETLAIIAYRQPVTRQEMENIRQVSVDSAVSTLMEKHLIREVGRRNVPGRPILYGTTEEFLSFFGLNSLDNLPELDSLALENTE
jgi:segregation and condensation protein B